MSNVQVIVNLFGDPSDSVDVRVFSGGKMHGQVRCQEYGRDNVQHDRSAIRRGKSSTVDAERLVMSMRSLRLSGSPSSPSLSRQAFLFLGPSSPMLCGSGLFLYVLAEQGSLDNVSGSDRSRRPRVSFLSRKFTLVVDYFIDGSVSRNGSSPIVAQCVVPSQSSYHTSSKLSKIVRFARFVGDDVCSTFGVPIGNGRIHFWLD